MPPTQDDINKILWKACDTFRGVVDPSDYKNYVLVMLFLKYISDVWNDHKATLEKKYPGDPTMVARQLKRERFVLSEESTFDYLFDRRTADNIGELIDEALARIEEDNHPKLEGVFRKITFNSDNLGSTKDRNNRLKHLLEDFADERLDLRPSVINEDIIGNAYMYMIERFAADSGKKGGEFYTPTSVSKLLAKLVAPQPGDRICDPACGSCSLLIRAAEEVAVADPKRARDYSLYGQESNGATWALGRMNLFLHDKDSADIKWANTLTDPQLLDGDRLMKFDIVIANPPFSLDKWGAEKAPSDAHQRFVRGVPPKSKGDFAFILHMVETALPRSGRVGVIVSHGVLFRGGTEGKIRKALIEENLLDAVIGLPENLFFGTGIPAAILIFDRRREAGGPLANRKDILFIDASAEFLPGKNQNTLHEEHVQKIVSTLTNRASVDRYSSCIALDDIRENEFNLNVPRYVETFQSDEAVNITAVRSEMAALEKELSDVQAKLERHLRDLGFA